MAFDGSAVGAAQTIGGAINNLWNGQGNPATQNGSTNFLQEMNDLQQQELSTQYGLAKQQQAFNDTMQQASENAHEVASVQTFGQDVTNARNTLTSSDQQQIK